MLTMCAHYHGMYVHNVCTPSWHVRTQFVHTIMACTYTMRAHHHGMNVHNVCTLSWHVRTQCVHTIMACMYTMCAQKNKVTDLWRDIYKRHLWYTGMESAEHVQHDDVPFGTPDLSSTWPVDSSISQARWLVTSCVLYKLRGQQAQGACTGQASNLRKEQRKYSLKVP